MININFLVGMPRAGNTILSSILNQNPNVKMSAHSILPTLLDSILQIKNHERFLNFPDSHGIDNIIENIFDQFIVIWLIKCQAQSRPMCFWRCDEY